MSGLGMRRFTQSLGPLRRLDQLHVAVAELDVAPNPQVGARRQCFNLLVLALLKAQYTEVMQRCRIVRLGWVRALYRPGP